MSINYVPRTFVSGEVTTAAHLNAEIRDPLTGLQAVWEVYTPVWSSSGTQPVLNNGTRSGACLRAGKSILGWRAIFTMGSTTTYGTGNYLISLPYTPLATLPTHSPLAQVSLLDASPAGVRQRTATLSGVGANTVYMRDEAGAVATPTAPFTWAQGDQIVVEGLPYEAA